LLKRFGRANASTSSGVTGDSAWSPLPTPVPGWPSTTYTVSSSIDYGHRLTTLLTAETHRGALGTGFLDIDLIIMALYGTGYNNPECFVTPEPLGPGGDPYPAMWGRTDPSLLDALVKTTAEYFYEREQEVLGAKDEELRR